MVGHRALWLERYGGFVGIVDGRPVEFEKLQHRCERRLRFGKFGRQRDSRVCCISRLAEQFVAIQSAVGNHLRQ